MITTDRLVIRPWRDSDRAPYALMSQDAAVMRYLGPLQSRVDCDLAVDRMIASQAEHGCCFWALERRGDGAFLGFCGIKPGRAPIEGLPEIGWRLGSRYWRQGYAREAATACLEWAWSSRDWPAVHAITVPANHASWGLMERLGMRRVEDGDFDHPDLPEGNPLRRHIRYRIDRIGARNVD